MFKFHIMEFFIKKVIKIKQRNLNDKIIKGKEQNIEVLIISVIVALGINLLSTGLTSLFNLDNNTLLLIIIGSVLSILVIFLYMILRIKSFDSVTEINGCFIFNKRKKDILPINNFQVSIDMKDYLNALLLERKDEKEKLDKCDYINSEDCYAPNEFEDDYFKNIISSLIEYLILNNLSSYLNDYYNETTDNVIEYNINNLPDEIKNNIFLSTIAKDISTRDVFGRKNIGLSEICRKNDSGDEEVFISRTSDGYIYNKFIMLLPKYSKIYKDYINELTIDTRYYKIKIRWYFNYYGSNVDNEFYQYVLKKKRNWDYDDDFNFQIQVDVSFKPSLIFNKNKMKHYAWLDEILNNLIDYFDYNNFLEQINWNLIKNLLNCSDDYLK